jgi:hypothetical protein
MPNRRDILKTTGVSAGVALGVSGARAQHETASQTERQDTSPQARDATKVFTATADSGYININSDSNQASERISLSGGNIGGAIEIEGVVYSDNTWESTRVDFPNLDPQALLESFGGDLPIDPGSIEADISVQVDPVTGQYNASSGLMTADLSLSISVVITSPISADLSISASAVLTTGESGSMTGEVQGGLEGGSATATLVSNDFDLPATGETISVPLVGDINIDEELGLPSPAGQNYLQLVLSMDITDVDEGPTGPVPISTFTGTGTNGFISLGTDDPQKRRGDFGSENGSEYSIDGQIYSDGTWESTNIDISSVGLDELIKNQATFSILGFDISVASVQTTVNVEPIEGKYRPQQGLVTGDFDMAIDFDVDLTEVAGITVGGLKFKLNPDLAPLTTKVSDGPNTRDGMEGSASGLASSSPQVSLVSQEFNVDGVSGSDTSIAGVDVTGTINNVLNLPALAGSNWIQLDLDLSVDNPQAIDDALVFDPVVEEPPRDLNTDELFEDVDGDGNFNTIDVQALFDNLDSDPVQNQADILSFAGGLNRSSVGVVDVQALYDAFQQSGGTPGDIPAPPDVIVPTAEITLSLQGGADEITVGNTVEYDLVVDGATQGIGAFDFSISVRDSSVATITDVDFTQNVREDDTAITGDGGRLDLRGAMLGSPFSAADSITIATVEVQAEQAGAATSAEFDVGSFPDGLFGAGAEQYEVASSQPRTLSVEYLAEIVMEDQQSAGGTSVTIDEVNMGDEGAYVGIWRSNNGTPTQLLGVKNVDSSGVVENVTVDLDQPISGTRETIAAVHPADDSGPDTAEVLARDTATIDGPPRPPQIAPGLPGPPKDIDGDGRYEAVRGNDEVTTLDVQTLFSNLNSPEVQNNARAFNFFDGGNPDTVTVLDVQALFNKIV